MKRKCLAVVIILLFTGTGIIPAIAQDIEKPSQPTSIGGWLYVGGSGPGNYTRIQDAIDNASNGDTVFIYNDLSPYYENVHINKSIQLIGENKSTTCIDAQYNGTVIEIHADNVTVTNLCLQHSGRDMNAGIALYGSGCDISNNIITEDFHGISVYFANNNSIHNNDLQNNNGNYNIYFYYTNHSTIENNVISNPFQYTVGITTYHCDNNTIRNNSITMTYNGILISATTDSILEANRVTDCRFIAVVLDDAPDTIVRNNVFEQPTDSSRGCDITFSNSPRCVVENNTLYSGVVLRDSYPMTILNNLVQDKPLVYLEGKTDMSIDYPCGQIILFYCRNIIVKNQDIKLTVCAVYLKSSDGCTLINNSLTSNGQGIFCSTSHRTTISDNTINSNYDYALTIDASNNNTIINNIISYTMGWGLIVSGDNTTIANNEISNNGFIGFALRGHNISVINNTVSDNSRGLDIRFLTNSIIKRNKLQRNSVFGISVTESINNTFEQNIFTGNVDGITIGYQCTRQLVRNNEFRDNQNGLLLDNANDNIITKNNFINNEKDAFFQDSYRNVWLRNYWGQPRLFHIIWGSKTIYIFEHATRQAPRFHIDWLPALRPFDIPT